MTHLLPRTLFGRLALILIVGLVMAHVVSPVAAGAMQTPAPAS